MLYPILATTERLERIYTLQKPRTLLRTYRRHETCHENAGVEQACCQEAQPGQAEGSDCRTRFGLRTRTRDNITRVARNKKKRESTGKGVSMFIALQHLASVGCRPRCSLRKISVYIVQGICSVFSRRNVKLFELATGGVLSLRAAYLGAEAILPLKWRCSTLL